MKRRRSLSKNKSPNLVLAILVIVAIIIVVFKFSTSINRKSVLGSFIAQTGSGNSGLPNNPGNPELISPTSIPPHPVPTAITAPTEIPPPSPQPTFSLPSPTISPSENYPAPSPTPNIIAPPPGVTFGPNLPIVVKTNNNTAINLVDNNVDIKVSNQYNQLSVYVEILPARTSPEVAQNPAAFVKPSQVLTADKNVFDIVAYWLALNHINLTPMENGGFLIEHQGVTAQTPYPLSINLPRNELAAHTPYGPINVSYLPNQATDKAVDTRAVSKITNNGAVYLQFQTYPKPDLYYIFPGQSEKFCFAFWPTTLKRIVFVSAQTNQVVHTSEPFINRLLDVLCL